MAPGHRTLCLALMGISITVSGCAGRQHPTPDPKSDLPLALPQALAVARGVLEERGFVVVPQADGTILTTLWRESFMGSEVAGVWTRYSVFGTAISESTSRIRVIRAERYASAVLPGTDAISQLESEIEDEATNPTDDLERRADARIRGDPTQGDADTFHPKTHSSRAARDFGLEAEIQRRISGRSTPAEEVMPARTSETFTSSPALLLDRSRCGDPVPGFEDVANARTLVFGEVHGTVEAPRFVGQAVCTILLTGKPVTVALELPREEQARVDRFVESSGSKDDVDRLLEGFFWNRPDQDGRSSRAMLALLQELQTFRLAELPVRVLAMDEPGLTGAERAEAMARPLLRAQQAEPEQTFVVLVGNLNARVTEDGMRPTLASLLAKAERANPLLALDMAFSGGTAWTCELRDRLECGVSPIKAGPANYRSWGWAVNRGTDFRLRAPHVRRMRWRHLGIDGTYYLGKLTASPPASSSQ